MDNKPKQTAYDGFNLDNASMPKTPGRTAVDIPANTPKVGTDKGNPVGTGTQGTTPKPYTLKG